MRTFYNKSERYVILKLDNGMCIHTSKEVAGLLSEIRQRTVLGQECYRKRLVSECTRNSELVLRKAAQLGIIKQKASKVISGAPAILTMLYDFVEHPLLEQAYSKERLQNTNRILRQAGEVICIEGQYFHMSEMIATVYKWCRQQEGQFSVVKLVESLYPKGTANANRLYRVLYALDEIGLITCVKIGLTTVDQEYLTDRHYRLMDENEIIHLISRN